MMAAPFPAHETERLKALLRYDILDTAEETNFNQAVKLVSLVCKTPIALISLVDGSRQWFKARTGLDVAETPREFAFCAHAILGKDLFVVSDTYQDKRFFDHPLVLGEPFIRFYAGMPLTTPKGFNVGTLCVIDRKPRELTAEQISAMKTLAKQVVVQLEARVQLQQLEKF